MAAHARMAPARARMAAHALAGGARGPRGFEGMKKAFVPKHEGPVVLLCEGGDLNPYGVTR